MSATAEELLSRLAASVLDGPGDLDHDVRKAIAARSAELAGARGTPAPSIPEALVTLVEKVALHAYKVTDQDIQALKDAGYTEDAIFEAIVSAALGAGRVRYERGMTAMRREV